MARHQYVELNQTLQMLGLAISDANLVAQIDPTNLLKSGDSATDSSQNQPSLSMAESYRARIDAQIEKIRALQTQFGDTKGIFAQQIESLTALLPKDPTTSFALALAEHSAERMYSSRKQIVDLYNQAVTQFQTAIAATDEARKYFMDFSGLARNVVFMLNYHTASAAELTTGASSVSELYAQLQLTKTLSIALESQVKSLGRGDMVVLTNGAVGLARMLAQKDKSLAEKLAGIIGASQVSISELPSTAILPQLEVSN
jgi:hypothetical protein